MMEHIRQFDWCSSQPETHFVLERDLDNCVTEKILRNKFVDPLLQGSDSDSDGPGVRINWDEVFKNSIIKDITQERKYVPGMRAPPPYPKQSALTTQQHYQCLKVLCYRNQHILPSQFVPRPTKLDYKLYEEVKTTYLNEQKEYLEWAKSLWTQHCLRALRPKPIIEMVYEAEFKIKAHMLNSFPKRYDLAAQISLESNTTNCNMVLQKELIGVDKKALPRIDYPETIDKKTTVIRACPVPGPCNKHPCKFVLPFEKSVSFLPLTEIHKELALMALDNGAQCVASESALKCLMELDRPWIIPISVCPVFSSEGDTTNIVILGSEFSNNKEGPQTRTYRALKHLLEFCFIPASEVHKVSDNPDAMLFTNTFNNNSADSMEEGSDDEFGNLFIDDTIEIETDAANDRMEIDEDNETPKRNVSNRKKNGKNGGKKKSDDNIGIFTCTCKDSIFEKPPLRSFKIWQLRNPGETEKYNMIVHCAHKCRSQSSEVILEPIPEYQIDMGASQLSEHKVKSLALSLLLRKNASLLTARVDCPGGDLVTIDHLLLADITRKHGNLMPPIASTFLTTLNQLQGLLPGCYLLQHEVGHGRNALLMAPRGSGALELAFAAAPAPEADAQHMLVAPQLEPTLLPFNKSRKILPCAFTPYPNLVVKETKKPPAKQKLEPEAVPGQKKHKKRKKKSAPAVSPPNDSQT